MMRKGSFILIIVIFCFAGPIFGQTYDDIKNAMTVFSTDIATTLPFLSAVGLNWNDAYIGNFPHFGIGVSAGFAAIPYSTLQNAATTFGADISGLGPTFQLIGVPLPMWCIDARLGGLGIPFDVGFKIGFLPTDVKDLLPQNVTFDFLMIGGDFRLGLLEDKGPIPDFSIGVGVTYLTGGVTMAGITPAQTIDLQGVLDPGHNINIAPGDFHFDWKAMTLDFKAQVSKNLLFITLSVGVGASYSVYATAGGGVETTVTDSFTGLPFTQAQIDALKAYDPSLDLSSTSLIVNGIATGWTFRVFGGISLEIFVLKIDINAMYNILSNAIGATANVRLQF